MARDELSVQQVQAEQEVSNRLTAIFGVAKKDTCTWYHKGQSAGTINSQRTRNAYLSKICDKVYNENSYYSKRTH